MFKKLKEFWKKMNDGEEHTLIDIDIEIPDHIIIFIILVILLALWTVFK